MQVDYTESLNKTACIIAPNLGMGFGRGGGSKVVLAMSKALVADNWHVDILSFYSLEKAALKKIYEVNEKILDKISLYSVKKYKHVSSGLIKLVDASLSVLPVDKIGMFLSSIMLSKIFQQRKSRCNLVIFNDDPFHTLLRPAKQEILINREETKVFVYYHFPYVARILYGAKEKRPYDIWLKKSLERLMEYLLLIYQLAPYKTLELVDCIFANSTVTARFLRLIVSSFLSKRVDIKILYPPVTTYFSYLVKNKKNTHIHRKATLKKLISIKEQQHRFYIVSIGSFTPHKEHEIILYALKKIKHKNKIRVFLIGFAADYKYENMLRKIIKKENLEKNVVILKNIPKVHVWHILEKAHVLIHPAQFEHFGIAVVEGMSAGLVPIVRIGEKSGPWIDILERGKFGFGFRDSEELANILEELYNDDEMRIDFSEKAFWRSFNFDEENFIRNFLEITRYYFQ